MKHLIISDCQIKPGHDLDYLRWIGNYIVAKKPERIICIGDFADMPSLSSYDVGKKTFEGRRYKDDITAANAGMTTLLEPIKLENDRLKKNKEKLYRPTMDLFMGNHEERINRAVNSDPKLEGVLSTDDLGYQRKGWTVHPYLDVIVLDGVAYSHFFTSGIMGRPVSSAAMLLTKKHQSCVMGHVQDRQIAYARRADGRAMTAIFSGLSHPYDEDYLGPQGNNSWRGIWMLHEVNDGAFDEMPISLSFLKRKYGA
jgi:hypothetical protein